MLLDSALKKDLYRYLGEYKGFRTLYRGLMLPGFRYIFLLRKSASSSKMSIKGIFYRLLLRRYTYKYGFQIPMHTKIGEGFYIGHFGNVVINEKAVIGRNCNITHGATIGQANRGKLKGYPIIGDFVWIGAYSIIVGNIKIGNNVLIAPGAYVNFDVPDNSIVIGNPGKIISKLNPTDGYINNNVN